jgi:hypothetical protein
MRLWKRTDLRRFPNELILQASANVRQTIGGGEQEGREYAPPIRQERSLPKLHGNFCGGLIMGFNPSNHKFDTSLV